MVHKLKNPSSFIVVVLRSLRHKACVKCGKPINSLEESSRHWEEELEKAKGPAITKAIMAKSRRATAFRTPNYGQKP